MQRPRKEASPAQMSSKFSMGEMFPFSRIMTCLTIKTEILERFKIRKCIIDQDLTTQKQMHIAVKINKILKIS